MERRIAELSPHEQNIRIYGDDLDAELVESIRRKGVLAPLIVTDDGTIISGHRRWRAAQVVDLASVPVTLFRSNDPLDILEALIESNRQRIKTNEQLGREAMALLEIERERARRRMLSGRPNPKEPVPEGDGQSRDAVGQRLGVSGKTVEQAAKAVSTIDRLREAGLDDDASALADTLNQSIKRAAEQAKTFDESSDDSSSKTNDAPTFSVDAWLALADAERSRALSVDPSGSFNRQDSDSIEWAQWSWNPVTGCLHNCPYCYARDIAERFYPQGFAPTLHPARLGIPRTRQVPSGAADNIGLKNVFTCSMADLFGRWVPDDWIDAVLASVRAAPQWNFLFLTKFPQRLTEFSFPDNAWVGTSVDCQARVAGAEKAFRKVKAKVKWLSCEPLIEPLKFSSLEMFDWLVIGGASPSTQTPAYRPPRQWVTVLEDEAERCGIRIYEKTNLIERRREYPGDGGSRGITTKPEEMQYLAPKPAAELV